MALATFQVCPATVAQDIQAFYDGGRIKIRPISMEAMFDRPIEGSLLSDHDGYLVYYRISWDPADFLPGSGLAETTK